jgi:DNA-binding transcriptional regulator GbsR (MarR family)
VTKVFKPGERRDYFVGEKDVWKIARQVAKIRKTRELDPILKLLTNLKELDIPVKNEDTKQFQKLVNEIYQLATKVDRLIEGVFKAEESWFWDKMLKLFAK